MTNQTPDKAVDQPVNELKLIVSELMLGVSGIKNKYGSPTVNPKPMNDELDELYYKTVERLQAECNRALASQRQALRDKVMGALPSKYGKPLNGPIDTADKEFGMNWAIDQMSTAISTIFEDEK